MTNDHSLLENAQIEAQGLHRKINANISKAEASTWADVKAVQTDIAALGTAMKALAADQLDDTKAGMMTAISGLEAAVQLVEDKAAGALNGVKNANTVMLQSAHQAAQSLGVAVAAARTKLAHAIDPKTAT